MKKSALMRLLLVGAIALAGFGSVVGTASAQDVDDACESDNNADNDATATSANDCSNAGDADSEAEQAGTASSGDGVAGQVAGVVSAGDASVDATNRSDDVSVDTGDATGTNAAAVQAFAGVAKAGVDGDVNDPCESDNDASDDAASASSDSCANVGDASAAADQSADAASGDGVGGQVIGVVTSAGGSADLVLDNESSDSDVDTGDGTFANASAIDGRALTFDASP